MLDIKDYLKQTRTVLVTQDAFDELVKKASAQPEKRTNKRTETHECDLISRQDAIDALGEEPMVWIDSDWENAERDQWRRDVNAIKALSSAQPEPSEIARDIADIIENEMDMRVIRQNAQPERKTGRWIEPSREGCLTFDYKAFRECSVCRKKQFLADKMNYCPNCGAHMVEVEHEAD